MLKLLRVEFIATILQRMFLFMLIGVLVLGVTNAGNIILPKKEIYIMNAESYREPDGTYSNEVNLERGRNMWKTAWALTLSSSFRSILCIMIPVLYVSLDISRRKISNMIYSGWSRNRVFFVKYIKSVVIVSLLVLMSWYTAFFASPKLWNNAIFISDVMFFLNSTLVAWYIVVLNAMICTSLCFILKKPLISSVISFFGIYVFALTNPILAVAYGARSMNLSAYYIIGAEPEIYTKPFQAQTVLLTVFCIIAVATAYISFKRTDLK